MDATFETIGLEVPSEKAINFLAARAENQGEPTRLSRRGAVLHGRCWKLGEGLEVWTVLYESGTGDVFYANCRPGFRARYMQRVAPWALTEYDEEGEAVVHGYCDGAETEVLFELQNLTEVGASGFRAPALYVGLCGLAYRARVCARQMESRWLPLEKAAVNLEDERPAFRRIEAARPEHPALDLPAVGSRELDALRRGDEARREQLVVETGEAPRLAPHVSGGDVPRIDGGGDHRREAPARAVQRPRDELMRAHRLRAHVPAARRARIRVCCPLIRPEEEDAPPVRPRGRQRLHVRAHVADDDRADGAVPSLEQVTAGPAGLRKRPEVDVPRGGADRAMRRRPTAS